MSLSTARNAAIAKLRAAGIENPSREAELLLGAVFPKTYGDFETIFTPEFEARYQAVVDRRAKREPLSHITGRRAFWEHSFHVSSAVLDPRPDTETLVEAALNLPFSRVLDLGTGSGCILLSLLAARPEARGVGVDISEAALAVAEQNRAMLELEACAELNQSDWFANVEGQFDLIVSNPPYITAEVFETLQPEVREFEPKIALTPRGDGLDCYRVIAGEAASYLRSDGHLMLEIGFDQADTASEILRDAGWCDVTVGNDLSGHPRVISAKRG